MNLCRVISKVLRTVISHAKDILVQFTCLVLKLIDHEKIELKQLLE